MDANEAMDALDVQVSKVVASLGCDLVPVVDMDSLRFFLCVRLGDGTIIPVKTPAEIEVLHESSERVNGYEISFKVTSKIESHQLPDNWFFNNEAEEARQARQQMKRMGQ